MTRKIKIILAIVIFLILLAAAFLFWEKAKAPTNTPEQTSTTPTPTPTPSQTPTPTPPATTKGTVYGQVDTETLHIVKIDIYDSTGSNLVASVAPDASGSYSVDLDAGSYKVDYEASPDLYPHEKETIVVKAGQTHEVDYLIDTN